jgi:hypothetical protein
MPQISQAADDVLVLDLTCAVLNTKSVRSEIHVRVIFDSVDFVCWFRSAEWSALDATGREQSRHGIPLNLEPGSNELDESEQQPEKHNEQRISTFRGMVVGSSDDHENADDSTRVNRESDSNEINESEQQSEKHREPTVSTFRGIVAD